MKGYYNKEENKIYYNQESIEKIKSRNIYNLLNVLDVDHKAQDGLRTEIIAYQKFNPDVVVDDASVYTFFVKQVAKKPRAAVQRTGMFPGAIPGSKTHVHSMGQNVNMKEFDMVRNFGLRVPQHFDNNQKRFIVYFTFGNVARANKPFSRKGFRTSKSF